MNNLDESNHFTDIVDKGESMNSEAEIFDEPKQAVAGRSCLSVMFKLVFLLFFAGIVILVLAGMEDSFTDLIPEKVVDVVSEVKKAVEKTITPAAPKSDL